ncbi:hypothetical protein [Sinorhizobium fredii]|uniref:Uncharacterized protein n=1 Tax=Rhizobium fredii TaxID=380 RepID=A0A2L0HAT1_RHIFR|nr:hypothetical protein [Sinorhizobium fredii]AUX77819.1 hypothetical protein NXT3_CH03277 [Sinorhizobium fredii]
MRKVFAFVGKVSEVIGQVLEGIGRLIMMAIGLVLWLVFVAGLVWLAFLVIRTLVRLAG